MCCFNALLPPSLARTLSLEARTQRTAALEACAQDNSTPECPSTCACTSTCIRCKAIATSLHTRVQAHSALTPRAHVQRGDQVTFSVRPANGDAPRHFQVSYEAFIDDVRAGDAVVIDGGMAIVQVDSIEGPDVFATVVEPGKVMSRANLTLRRNKELVRGYSSMLPVVTAKDWQDIDWAVQHQVRTAQHAPVACGMRMAQEAVHKSHNAAASLQFFMRSVWQQQPDRKCNAHMQWHETAFLQRSAVQIDFLAISFVRDDKIIDNVRAYVNSQMQRHSSDHKMDIVAKIEAYDSVAAMPEIIKAADAIMVARSDLGAQIPMEDVPAVQREIVFRCRQVPLPASMALKWLQDACKRAGIR